MNAMIKRIEKMKPFFDKISNNSYLRAIRDGFISLIPVILFQAFFIGSICSQRIQFSLGRRNRVHSNESV